MVYCVIIEDQPAAAEVIQHILDKNFTDLKVAGIARNSEEGVKLIRSKSPDLVLTDVELPGGSGFDVLNMTSDQFY